jgi:hypothetical protein
MNAEFFNKGKLPTAVEVLQQQSFGKPSLQQTYTAEATFLHIVLFLLKRPVLFSPLDFSNLVTCTENINTLWKTWQMHKDIDFTPLRQLNTDWEAQKQISDEWVGLLTACLLHYDLDLATTVRFIGGNHVGAHHDPDVILHRIQGLVDEEVYHDMERLLTFGMPAILNYHAARDRFATYYEFGNHQSIDRNLDQVMPLMNKEDKCDNVLSLPKFLVPFIPHLGLTPQALLQVPGKND